MTDLPVPPSAAHPAVLLEVDITIERLAKKRFTTDPVVGERHSRSASIVSSAYKRHGSIIEHALVHALMAAPHLEVWPDPIFRVSPEADMLSGNDASALGTSLRYGADNFTRTLQVDMLVYNRGTKRLSSYEVKRGFGYHDSGKKRSMLRDLRCMQMLLLSYGRAHDLHVATVEAHMIFYYGQCSVGPPWALTRAELDEHFNAPITAQVEQINDYFKGKLDALLTSI